MSLSAWFPRDPVPVLVGGSVAIASELRIRDLAALESFVAALLVSPLHGLDGAAEDDPDGLRAAYDLAESWPPAIGSPAVQGAILRTAEGRAAFLSLALRATPIPPGVSPVDHFTALAGRITPDEFAAIERVAWAIPRDWRADVMRRIDDHLGLPGFAPRAEMATGETITLAKAVGMLIAGGEKCDALAWATPEAVGNLTLGQWRAISCGGEPEERGDPLPEDPELADRVNRARYRFFTGKDMPEAAPDEDAHLTDGPPPELCVGGEDTGEWETAF